MKSSEKYLNKINDLAKKIKRNIKLMEVCGTHTQVIAQYGIKNVLPSNIKLVSGPGCPVCVTAKSDIDNVVAMALSGIPIFAYGDIIRVRGNGFSLAEAREMGASVREVYGAEEIFKLNKKTVFFGIGFETTAPMTASIIKRGAMVYSAHKAFIPAMKALLQSGEIKIDGLISPGHVAAIVGADVFKDFKTENNKYIPQVIAGFEIEDVFKAIILLLKQIADGRAETENAYTRVVLPEGNIKALKLIDEVFEVEDSEWRGLGVIPNSGFKLRKEFEDRDAKIIYGDIITQIDADVNTDKHRHGCLCGSVIKGLSEPQNCSLFGKFCTPENPQGPCMVSVEGSCCVAYKNKTEKQ
ncbi:MAG: hydrogenase formation protein HypD [bacterium]